LERSGSLREIHHPESQLDFAIWQAQRKQEQALSLSFLPFPALYPSRLAPNAAYLLWDYPEIPHPSLTYTPRPDWIRMAEKLAVILVGSNFTAEAVERSGIKTPVEIVPPPVSEPFFHVPAWNSERVTHFECNGFLFPQAHAGGHDPWDPGALGPGRYWNVGSSLKDIYRRWLKPALPKTFHKRLVELAQKAEGQVPAPALPGKSYLPCEPSRRLILANVVYTAVISPSDPNENWRDLLSAYTSALRDREDATLVMVLNIGERRRSHYLHRIYEHYLRQVRGPRCRLALVIGPLTERHKLQLALGTTYFVTTPRTRGVSLPLEQFLAAARPAIAPCHTGLTDCFGFGAGLVVASHPEPARIPEDPERRFVTARHRIVWQSLHDHFLHSYELAKENSVDYQAMATRARRRARAWAGTEVVWRRLQAALAGVHQKPIHSRAQSAHVIVR
jgi:hypothetical protein